MEAKLTIEKLQEDNVRNHFCVAAENKMKHVKSSMCHPLSKYPAHNTQCVCVIVAVGLIVSSGFFIF